jgi:hypothetical protein
VYLDCALKSNPTLEKAIAEGKLFAFADDLLVIADGKDEASQMIKGLESMETTFLLKLNKEKTNILCDHKDFKQEKQVEGIKLVEKVKYLGLRISLNKKDILRDAKNDVKRNLVAMTYRVST